MTSSHFAPKNAELPDNRAAPENRRVEVAILIITYNSEEQIEDCLRSAIEQQGDSSQEIIVVDNCSTDRTVEIVRESFPEVRLFSPGENLGFAKGVNYAARQANADYLLLLNPDTIVLDRAVDIVLSFARANPKYGYYGGRTLKKDGVSLERSSCWGEPTLWSQLMFSTGLNSLFRETAFFDPESLGSWQRDSVREVGVITGCFLLVERRAWEAIGGFDEHFWLYGEDVDLSTRARKAGYRPVIVPEARIIHEIGKSSTSAQKFIWLYRGKVSYINKHFSPAKRRFAIALLKAGVALRAFLCNLTGRRNSHWPQGWKSRAEWENGHPPEKPQKSTP